MNKEQFAEKVTNPTNFTSQDRGWLHSIATQYPYSSVVSYMAYLADHAFQFDSPIAHRQIVLSLYDENALKHSLQNAKPMQEEAPIDILNEINTFQEVSFKTAPKSVILSNFLSFDDADDQEITSEPPVHNESEDKKSLLPDESLGTETLAIILEKQGKIDKALTIYKNLLANNPEKSSTFAPQIERLSALLK